MLYSPINPLLTDPGRWDRYSYGSGFRDPRPYDRRYWYDTEYDPYRKESYAYADRWVTCTLLRGGWQSELYFGNDVGAAAVCGFLVTSWLHSPCLKGVHGPDPPRISPSGLRMDAWGLLCPRSSQCPQEA